jgi:hypothetical protein
MVRFDGWTGLLLCLGAMATPGVFAQDKAPGAEAATRAADDRESETHRRRMDALLEAMASGPSPREQLLAAEYRSKSGAASGTITPALIAAARHVTRDRVAQWTASSLAARAAACDASCADAAAGPARLEPDNAAAWLPMLARAARDGDAARVDEAFAAMASATRFDDAFVDTAQAWAEIFAQIALPGPPEFLPADRPIIAGIAISAAAVIHGYQDLLRSCNSARVPDMSGERRDQCARIGRTMLSQGNTALGRMTGMAVLRQSGTATASDVALSRREQWQHGAVWRTFGLSNDPAENARYLRDLVATGDEIEARSRQLTRLGIALEPPADWTPAH